VTWANVMIVIIVPTLSSAYVVDAAEFGRERTFYGSKLPHLLSWFRSAEPAASGPSLGTLRMVK